MYRIALVLLAACIFSPAVIAQTKGPNKDMSYIPAESVGMIRLNVQSLVNAPATELLPVEMLTVAAMEEVGFDPLKIEQIDFLFGPINPMSPAAASRIVLQEAINLDDLNDRWFSGDWYEEGEWKMRDLEGAPDVVLIVLDDRHAVVGSKNFAMKVAKGNNRPGKLTEIYASITGDENALALVTLEPLRPILEGAVSEIESQMPEEQFEKLLKLIEQIEYVALPIVAADTFSSKLIIGAENEQTVQQVATGVYEFMEFAREKLLSEMPFNEFAQTAMDQAMVKYAHRASQTFIDRLRPKPVGNQAIIDINQIGSTSTTSILVGLLLPAVQSARAAAQRMSSQNNLRNLGLAVLNYESAYRVLPPAAIVDEDGNPLLSWRVAILPFIEEGALYQQFHLDEPWDSEHNIQLLERMPNVFRHPESLAQEGHTVYLANVGEETGLRPTEGVRLSEFLDGLSTTIFAVEVVDEAAVPWTAPMDYEADQVQPTLDLRVNQTGSFAVIFFDGAVRMFSIDADDLWAYFTRSGGEAVNFR